MVEGSLLDGWETTHPDFVSLLTVVTLKTTEYRQEHSAQGKPPRAALNCHPCCSSELGKLLLPQVAPRQGQKGKLAGFSWPKGSTT